MVPSSVEPSSSNLDFAVSRRNALRWVGGGSLAALIALGGWDAENVSAQTATPAPQSVGVKIENS
jgi:hypothetical protein